MGPFMELYYSLARQHQADLACEVSQVRLAAGAGRVRSGMADERLHGAVAIRLAHALAHAMVRRCFRRRCLCEDAARPRRAD
jgi:hypothetical protein